MPEQPPLFPAPEPERGVALRLPREGELYDNYVQYAYTLAARVWVRRRERAEEEASDEQPD